jgi:hypothetical protein
MQRYATGCEIITYYLSTVSRNTTLVDPNHFNPVQQIHNIMRVIVFSIPLYYDKKTAGLKINAQHRSRISNGS